MLGLSFLMLNWVIFMKMIKTTFLCLALLAPAVFAAEESDPWESYNRAIFTFNATTDHFIMKPIAEGYRYVTPKPMRRGISNVFSNVLEVRNVLNDVLQGKMGQAGHDTGRFLINTTLGVAGLFDVAQHMGLRRSDGEDFGQTLAVWGVTDGPYLMLPFLGPRTLRDAAAAPVDWVTNPQNYIDHTRTSNAIYATDVIHIREGLLDLEEDLGGIGSDKYILLRDVYLQNREYLVKDGEVEDTFGSDDEDFGDF